MHVRIPFIIALILIFCDQVSGQYMDPNFAKLVSGYGADGPYDVEIMSMEDPFFEGEKIEMWEVCYDFWQARDMQRYLLLIQPLTVQWLKSIAF